MIHHVSVGTNDPARAKRFYDAVLEVIGLRCLKANERAADYGTGEIMFSVETPVDDKPATVGNGVHVAFVAQDRTMVREFYRIALEHGGSGDGAPGVRPEYDENYYGAFVRDPDGNKIEAVTFSSK